MSAPRETSGHHFAEIDALKVAGIATIVLIHAMRSPWHADVSAAEVWLGHVTRFGVPAFLFASGFLYARGGPVSASVTGRRLRRIGVPYLIASVLAWTLLRGFPDAGSSDSLWRDLALANALGPYYYVLVIAGLVLVTPLVAQLGARALGAVTLTLIAAQWFVDVAIAWPMDLFWHLRNPLLWWGYFFLGWWVRLHADALSRRASAHRGALTGALVAALVALTALSGLEGSAPVLVVRTAAWLHVYAVLALVLVVATGRSLDSPALRFVSDATYNLYLFHLFFVYPVQVWVPPPAGELALVPVLLPWLAGLTGPMLIVAGTRKLLGERSRDVLGA